MNHYRETVEETQATKLVVPAMADCSFLYPNSTTTSTSEM